MKGQFVGLDNTADNRYDAAYGFIHVINCFDVEIDGARTLPRVYDRDGTANDSPAGTYGIGGSFTLFLKLCLHEMTGTINHLECFLENPPKSSYVVMISSFFICNLHFSNIYYKNICIKAGEVVIKEYRLIRLTYSLVRVCNLSFLPIM
ncbi:hypothetical protein V7152_18215 [Neobacillus drentensis]|uniref:hypothetical protein n=1 Tax=Neobacillus drentensis TaxID=220684 RepID=UPI003000CB69